MTDARTEPSIRDWLVDYQSKNRAFSESLKRDPDTIEAMERSVGKDIACRQFLAELDRREAVPTVTPDVVFVADPAGLWALIEEYVDHGLKAVRDWDMDDWHYLDRGRRGKQIRAALGMDSTP